MNLSRVVKVGRQHAQTDCIESFFLFEKSHIPKGLGIQSHLALGRDGLVCQPVSPTQKRRQYSAS